MTPYLEATWWVYLILLAGAGAAVVVYLLGRNHAGRRRVTNPIALCLLTAVVVFTLIAAPFVYARSVVPPQPIEPQVVMQA